MTDELIPRAYLYLGIFTTRKGKRVHGYYDCGPNPGFTVPTVAVDPSTLFVKPLFRWGRVGSVYAVEAGNGSVRTTKTSPEYLGELSAALRKAAEVRHEAMEQVCKNQQYAAKLADKRLSVDAFEPWRRVYATADRAGRAAIIARIYSYLEEGRSLFGN